MRDARRELPLSRAVPYLALLFPVATVLQGIPLLSGINRGLMALLMVMAALDLLTVTLPRGVVLTLALTGCCYVYALLATSWPLENPNDLFYFGMFVLCMFYFALRFDETAEAVRVGTNYLAGVVLVWHALVLISALFPSSYQYGQGDGTYFVSFSGNGFRLGPSALFTMAQAVLLYRVTRRRAALLLTVLPLLCGYACGSRTYLGLLALLFLCGLYMALPRKRVFYLSLVPLALLMGLLVAITPAMDKIAATTYTESSPFDFWRTVTNGRSVFWPADIAAYQQLSLAGRLFGAGFSYVYEINREALNASIWAHNDFLNLLLGFGASGLFCYLYSLWFLVKTALHKGGKIAAFTGAGFFLLWFVNAFFNMVYTYTCAVLALPFLLLAFGWTKEE